VRLHPTGFASSPHITAAHSRQPLGGGLTIARNRANGSVIGLMCLGRPASGRAAAASNTERSVRAPTRCHATAATHLVRAPTPSLGDPYRAGCRLASVTAPTMRGPQSCTRPTCSRQHWGRQSNPRQNLHRVGGTVGLIHASLKTCWRDNRFRTAAAERSPNASARLARRPCSAASHGPSRSDPPIEERFFLLQSPRQSQESPKPR